MARPRLTDQRMAQILDAFEACVVRNGLDGTTLEDVAREAGQPRSLVRYFAGNRAEMVSVLIDRMVERSTAKLRGLSDLDDGHDLAALLLGDYFDDPVTNTVMAELWHLAMRSPPLRERLSGVYRGVLDDLAGRVAPPGCDEPDDAVRDATYAIFAMGLGALVLRHFGLEANDPGALVQLAGRLLSTGSTDDHLELTERSDQR
jgi:AcrR family transcriptional regulator